MDELVEWAANKLQGDADPYCDCAHCYQLRQAAAEIRSLREHVEQERAGIVALLRTKAGVYAAAQFGVGAALLLDQADAIERHEDKETDNG